MTIDPNPPALARRLAEESQLLAERKWLIDALNKIKVQRNSLQIERLHLESLKTAMMITTDSKSQKRHLPPTPTPTAEDMMYAAPPSNRNKIELELQPLNEEHVCNQEELNLGVSSSALNNPFPQSMADEQSGEEYDEDDISDDDVYLDMNMLMTHDSDTRDTTDNLDEFILP